MMAVKIYTKDGCPYCAKALKSLQDRGADFEEINLSKNSDRIDELVNLAGTRKVPVIVEDGTVTIGFSGGG